MYATAFIWHIVILGMTSKFANDQSMQTKKDFIDMCLMGGEL